MIDSNTGAGTYASRIRRSRSGWRWTVRLLPAVLACTFAGAGQAQTIYGGGLDDAVGELVRTLVNEAGLRDDKVRVLVKSEDFFELGTELRLDLSEMLRGRSVAELTSRGVSVALAGSDEDAVRVLHGRWRREPGRHLYLELFVAAPVTVGDPTALKSVRGLVPIDESIGKAIEATLAHWGRLLVLRLEKGVRDRNKRKVLLQPMTIEGDGAQGGKLKQHLTNWLGNALVESRLFTLVEPPPGVVVETDGKLYVAAAVSEGRVEVSLRVLGNEYQRVTFATVGLDEELFPPGVIGPDVTKELATCAGLVGERRLGDAKACYEGVRDAAPGDAAAAAGARSGLERIEEIERVARAEATAVRGVEDAIGRVAIGEAREGLKRLRELNAGHPRLVELEGEIARAERLQPGYKFQDCPGCPELVVVSSGSFRMGSPSWEEGRGADEGPVHRVTFERPFAVGVYEVTFGEWDACVSAGDCGRYRPSDEGWGRGRQPVMNVSWDDAQAYVRWLSGKTGKEYRLLSESEWEYVARAGTRTPFHTGATISTGQANYDGNFTYGSGRKGRYIGKTVEVGSYAPNRFGLHDVHGNVWEWVGDCYNDGYHGAPSDGSAWESGDCSRRVVRGGSWGGTPRYLRSANRDGSTTGIRNY